MVDASTVAPLNVEGSGFHFPTALLLLQRDVPREENAWVSLKDSRPISWIENFPDIAEKHVHY